MESQLSEERELWKKICCGDADEFDAWYRQSAPHLRAFLRHVLGDEHAADDVMQEIFMGIWHRPRGFDSERGTLRGWLFGIARRQAAEWSRKQKPATELTHDPPGPSHLDTGPIVAEAFSLLSRDHRSLLWLREVEGQSYSELAATLDIPVGTVRSRLFAAREALRAVWHNPSKRPGGHDDMR